MVHDFHTNLMHFLVFVQFSEISMIRTVSGATSWALNSLDKHVWNCIQMIKAIGIVKKLTSIWNLNFSMKISLCCHGQGLNSYRSNGYHIAYQIDGFNTGYMIQIENRT